MVSDSLKLTNAIIGFCTRTHTWPHPLADLGYEACGVEREITVELGRQNRIVVVDLICASDHSNHVFCAETKSQTVRPEQVSKYKAMKSEDLVNMANLPETLDLIALSHDVIYVTATANAAVVAEHLADCGNPLPVLGGDASRFELHSGTISESILNHLLLSGIEIGEGSSWPYSYIPFTADSPDPDLAHPLGQALSVFLIRGTDFGSEDIAQQILTHWPWFGADQQLRLKRRISGLVDDAMKHELRDYYLRPDHRQQWKVIQSGKAVRDAARRLERAVAEFVDRIENPGPYQASLFES